MKILVDHMPINKGACPFSKGYYTSLSGLDKEANRWVDPISYTCKVAKAECDLNCGKCSGLMVLTCPM